MEGHDDVYDWQIIMLIWCLFDAMQYRNSLSYSWYGMFRCSDNITKTANSEYQVIFSHGWHILETSSKNMKGKWLQNTRHVNVTQLWSTQSLRQGTTAFHHLSRMLIWPCIQQKGENLCSKKLWVPTKAKQSHIYTKFSLSSARLADFIQFTQYCTVQ